MTRKAESLPDTNMLLRYLLKDDPDQYETALEYFEKVRSGRERALILEGVLVESIYILTRHYNVSRTDAANALAGLLLYKGVVNPEKGALLDALATYAATRLDPVDCILLSRSRSDSLRLVTFDKELMKKAAQ